jgi:hypothetical protein
MKNKSPPPIKTIKNFLPDQIFKEIRHILFSETFPYYFVNYVVNVDDRSDYFFTHHLFNENKSSKYFNKILAPLIGRLTFNRLARAKVNFYTKKHKFIKTAYHVDFKDSHLVALYSVNTNNGFTQLENGPALPSIENTIHIFDGSLKHCSVAQTDTNARINININLL